MSTIQNLLSTGLGALTNLSTPSTNNSGTSGGLLGSLVNGGGGILSTLLSPLTSFVGRQVRGVVGSDYNAGAHFTTIGQGGGISGLLGNFVNADNIENPLLRGTLSTLGIGTQPNVYDLYNSGRNSGSTAGQTTLPSAQTILPTTPATLPMNMQWNPINFDTGYPNYGIQWAGNPYGWGYPIILPPVVLPTNTNFTSYPLY